MTFDAREISIAGGRPIRLYEFTRSTTSWTYCSADRDVAWQTKTWKSLPISDDGVRISGETSADLLKVTAPGTLEVAQLYRGAPPSDEIWLTMRDYHDGETDVPASAIVAWIGTISGVRWPQVDRCEIACQSLAASMDRPGLRLTWERTCPYAVYDLNCRVNRDLYRLAGTVQSLDGVKINSGAFAARPNGYFSGGFVSWPVSGGGVEQRGIESHVGGDLVLLGGTAGLVLGMEVTAYAGCDQTAATCNDKFGNILNHGGVRHLPGRSPFDGNPVF